MIYLFYGGIFMTAKLTWKEIASQFPNEWVMLVNYKYSSEKDLDPSEGQVVAHARTRKEFSALLSSANVKDAAIRYTGRISDGRPILCKFKSPCTR
jgi:hypothetical protein